MANALNPKARSPDAGCPGKGVTSGHRLPAAEADPKEPKAEDCRQPHSPRRAAGPSRKGCLGRVPLFVHRTSMIRPNPRHNPSVQELTNLFYRGFTEVQQLAQTSFQKGRESRKPGLSMARVLWSPRRRIAVLCAGDSFSYVARRCTRLAGWGAQRIIPPPPCTPTKQS